MTSAAAAAAGEECRSYQRSFPDVRHLQPAECQAMLRSPGRVTLVDCRSDAERAVSMLPHAEGPSALERQHDPEVPCVIYCTVGFRSSLAARKFAASGRAPEAGVWSMAGILPWSHEGGELVDPATGAPTKRVHLFGSKWAAMAPVGYDVEVFPALPMGRQFLRVGLSVASDLSRRLFRALGDAIRWLLCFERVQPRTL